MANVASGCLDWSTLIWFLSLSMPCFQKTGIFQSLSEISPILGPLHFGLCVWGLGLLLRIAVFLCLSLAGIAAHAFYSKRLRNKNTSSQNSLETRSELSVPNKEEK